MADVQEYYITTKEGADYITYSSEKYALSELEFLNLIKILLVEQRSKSIGRKFLEIFQHVNKSKKGAQEKLSMMGIVQSNNEPTKHKRQTHR